jgi:hypothetical protein
LAAADNLVAVSLAATVVIKTSIREPAIPALLAAAVVLALVFIALVAAVVGQALIGAFVCGGALVAARVVAAPIFALGVARTAIDAPTVIRAHESALLIRALIFALTTLAMGLTPAVEASIGRAAVEVISSIPLVAGVVVTRMASVTDLPSILTGIRHPRISEAAVFSTRVRTAVSFTVPGVYRIAIFLYLREGSRLSFRSLSRVN